MLLIIGLGNPGKKFENTWHNLGFLAVENFKSQEENFSDWKSFDRAQSLISQGKINDTKIIIAKPQTFVNNSGRAVRVLTAYYKLPTINIIIIHDDADLPIGTVKVSKNSGSAGHKGAQSIIDTMGSKNFTRIRLGARPRNYIPGSKSMERFVLKKFSKADQKIVSEVIEKAIQAIEAILAQV